MSIQTKKIVIGGSQLSYIDQGSGLPAIFVHGCFNDLRAWSMQINPVSKFYRAISISRRYHYPNNVVAEGWDYSAINHAEDLATFIEELQLAPVHIIGHSYGAYACAILAARRPELIRSLILCEPPILPMLDDVPGGKSMVSDFMDHIWKPMQEKFQNGDLEQGVKVFIDGISGEGTFEKLPPAVHDMLMDNVPAMKVQAMALDQFSIFTCYDAQQIKKPVLLIGGEKSHKMLHAVLKKLERCLPISRTIMIPEASHNMHVANPQAFNEALIDFLLFNSP
jgi:non-heme chloroperoxidase